MAPWEYGPSRTFYPCWPRRPGPCPSRVAPFLPRRVVAEISSVQTALTALGKTLIATQNPSEGWHERWHEQSTQERQGPLRRQARSHAFQPRFHGHLGDRFPTQPELGPVYPLPRLILLAGSSGNRGDEQVTRRSSEKLFYLEPAPQRGKPLGYRRLPSPKGVIPSPRSPGSSSLAAGSPRHPYPDRNNRIA